MTPLISMRRALEDPDLFGRILSGESWHAWRILLIAAMGEPLSDEERAVYRSLTGRESEPPERLDELWAIIGRRSGKTRCAAILGAYLAALVDYSGLAPGERASLLIISASLWQAQKAHQYLDGIFNGVPALHKLVVNQTTDTISLSNRIDIETRSASFRTIRGGTAVAIIADEVGYWRSDESLNPDLEILNGARPSLATTHGMLVAISSPYARKGELWNAFKRHYGPGGDPAIAVAHAASRVMNPLLDERVVSRAYDRDPAAAAAEYGGEFRTDVESFVSREVVEAAIVPDRFELPPLSNVHYTAFADPSGGSADSMTLAIAHRENKNAILDAIREAKPPFSPESVVGEFAKLLKSYRIISVKGDRYAGEWPREQFMKHGIRYEPSDKPKSDIYRDVLPLLNGSRVKLLDNQRLVSQLCSLERRTSRGGKDSIDHPPRSHDDLANAVAGAVDCIGKGGSPIVISGRLMAWASRPTSLDATTLRTGTYIVPR